MIYLYLEPKWDPHIMYPDPNVPLWEIPKKALQHITWVFMGYFHPQEYVEIHQLNTIQHMS